MKTILVTFKGQDKVYTYNTNEAVAVGDTIKTDYLSTECKIVDVIEDSYFRYISKSDGQLKSTRNNVNDIFIKELETTEVKIVKKFFMTTK